MLLTLLTGMSFAEELTKPASQRTDMAKVTNAGGVVYTDGAYINDGWNITASSEMRPIANAFDDDVTTYWHSKYVAEGGQIVSRDEAPFTITVTFPSKLSIAAVRYIPRQIVGSDNSSAGIWKKAEIYGSEDGNNFTRLAEQSYDVAVNRASTDTAIAKKDYKAIRIIVTDSSYCTAGEIQFLPGTGNAAQVIDESELTPLTNKKKWQIELSSHKADKELSVSRLIDGNKNTYWHSYYEDSNGQITYRDPAPYDVTFTFPEDVTISGFAYLPRQDSSSGRFSKCELYASTTEDGDFVLLKEFATGTSEALQTAKFTANLTVRRFKVTITESTGVATAAEMDFLPADEKLSEISLEDYAAYEIEHKLYPIDRTDFSVKASCAPWGTNVESNIFDESTQTHWQTESSVLAPWTLDIDMKGTYTFCEMAYTPRLTDDHHGSWIAFELEKSIDGETYEFVDSYDRLTPDLETKHFTFDTPITARYLRITILEGYAKKASCSDLSFYQTKAEHDDALRKNSERYVLVIGSNAIDVTKGEDTHRRELDVAPFIDVASSSTLIPLRGLLEEMGAEVNWNGEDQSIRIESPSGRIEMQIQNCLVYAEHPTYGMVRYTLSVVPDIVNSRTFIPLRFVSEQLGYKVSWDGDTQTITIEK